MHNEPLLTEGEAACQFEYQGKTCSYRDSGLLSKLLKKIAELGYQYYIDCYGVVLTKWNGKWEPYHKVARLDKKLEVVL